MRVTHKYIPFFPDALRLEELGEVVADTKIEEEPIAEAFNNIVFQFIKPGLERTVVILKAQGLTYTEISWILGVERIKVHRTVYKIRDRLLSKNLKKYLENPMNQVGCGINNLTNGL